jgi:RHS repeat-associated protein
MGRIVGSTQSGYPAMTYAYNLADALTSFTFPSGRQQMITYDSGNRALGTTGMVPGVPTTYASGLTYWPNGALQQITTGATAVAAVQQFCQNNLLQITGVRVGSTPLTSFTTNSGCTAPTPPTGDIMFLGMAFGSAGANNGNVSSEQIVTSSGVNATQSFTYDAYNRLQSATENGGAPTWTQGYGYDAWGNRAVSGYILNADLTPTSLSQYNAKNQWVPGGGYTYDNVGNQQTTGSANSPGTAANTFAYDAENRLVTANIANTGNVTYAYDGEGRRVQKTVGTVVTNFVYNASGELVAEYSNGPLQAVGTEYLFDDHLGSTRLVMNGSVAKRYDYLPFGEEIPSGMDGRGGDYGAQVVVPSSPDIVNQKFTGKERDNETGLDYFGARYMSSAQGRFTSPDPFLNSGHPWEPQTWNRYSYVSNNPLAFTDPLGLYQWASACNEAKDAACHAARQRFRDALKRLEQARDYFDKKSDQYKRLDAARQAYGEENDPKTNNILISFDSKPGSPGGVRPNNDGTITVRFDDKTFAQINQRDFGIEYAAQVAHEGWHITTTPGLKPPQPYQSYFNDEYSAYENQSFVNRAFRLDSIVGIWNESWRNLDQHRDEYKNALKQQATRSATFDCAQDKGCKK